MKLKDKHIVYLLEGGFEDLEFWVPLMRLQEEGAKVTVVAPKMGTYTGKSCLKATPDATADQVSPEDFDGIVVPGGWAPDKLRRYPAILNLVSEIDKAGKIVATICHGGSVLISHVRVHYFIKK